MDGHGKGEDHVQDRPSTSHSGGSDQLNELSVPRSSKTPPFPGATHLAADEAKPQMPPASHPSHAAPIEDRIRHFIRILKQKMSSSTDERATAHTADAGPPQLKAKLTVRRARKREYDLVQALQNLQITEGTTSGDSGCKRRLLSSMMDGPASGAAGPGGGGTTSSKHGKTLNIVVKARTRRAGRAPSAGAVVMRLKATVQDEEEDGGGDKAPAGREIMPKTKPIDGKVPSSNLCTCGDASKQKKKMVRRPASEPGGRTGDCL